MNATSVTSFDYIILGIMAVSTLFAFFKGAIKTSLSLIGWVVASIITIVSLPYIKPLLLKHFHWNEMLVNFLAPSAVFFIVMIFVAIINYQILLITTPLRGGMVDRSLGFAIGLARGAFFSCLIFIMICMLSPILGITKKSDSESGMAAGAPVWIKNSQSYALLKNSSEYMAGLIPKDITANIAKFSPKGEGVEKVLSPSTSQLETLNKMIGALPKDVLTDMKMPKTDGMSEQEREKLIRTVINAYNGAVKNGDLDKTLAIPEAQIKELEKSVDIEKAYDDKQRNEIDRLIKIVK